MIHKRPFANEDSCNVACKFPRRLEHIDQLDSIPSLESCYGGHLASDGQGEDSFPEGQDIKKLVGDFDMGLLNGCGKDFETGTANCFPHFLWIDNGVLEADYLPPFQEFFDSGHQLGALLEPDELFSVVDYPFQKPVSVGPEHQAYIPEWHPHGVVTSSNQFEDFDHLAAAVPPFKSDGKFNDGYGQKLMGTCVIPMPHLESSENCVSTETECRCLDGGSIRCVRQHVIETRQKLKDSLGVEVFAKLGFCDMGEEVAKNWSEVEEEAFRAVVISNSASSGKNFWEHLSATFPTQTKMDLVSYYFNVFMLQKRAEQNRFDPSNIDSDNDEWQRSGDGMTGEDEDSVLESHTGYDTPSGQQEDDAMYGNEYVEDENENGFVPSGDDVNNAVHGVVNNKEYEGDVDDSSGLHSQISDSDCDVGTNCKFFNGACGNIDDLDVQDDSCTSYDDQQGISCGPFNRVTDERQSNQE